MEEIVDGDGKPPAIRTTTSSISNQPNNFQPLSSPSLLSPPSSAFVSALQSPYISPRAAIVTALPSPPSHSTSDDVPTTSYTPPPEYFDFPDSPLIRLHKLAGCIPAAAMEPVPPRVSFSFQVPRVNLAKSGITASSAGAKLRSCDVYIGYHGHRNSNIARFCKWLKSELELQGIACFVADRAKYGDAQSHETANRIICSVTFGVVVVSATSCSNPSSVEEMTFFAQKKNLIPLLFGVDHSELTQLLDRSSDVDDKEWREAIDGLVRCHEQLKLETSESSWRSCVGRTVAILKSKLGRKSCEEKGKEREVGAAQDIPFPRNIHFVGREKELSEMEATLFGSADGIEAEEGSKRSWAANGIEDVLGDDEWETMEGKKRLNVEVSKCKEPTLEAWIDPTMESRSLQKQRPKHKRWKIGGGKGSGGGVLCINGGAGVGKTELALEFAHRSSQRYKTVLWVGGEAKYLRQNILNLSVNLGLDVSAEAERERGRRRSFEEQEQEAFHRVKRELFRDIPYLLIIDNLESEEEWWEGKDLHNLIPRNTGATHVVITTRLPQVMSFDPLLLPVLTMADFMSLIKGKRKEDYSDEELAVLKKFDERLSRSSFGASLVGSLLSELLVAPSTLFNAIDRIAINDKSSSLNRNEERFCRSNLFLMKTIDFCFAMLSQSGGKRDLALRMLLAGAWLAPAPVSATLLAVAAENIPHGGSGLNQWRDCVGKIVRLSCSCVTPPSRKSEAESALILVRMGLARRVSKQCWIQLHDITQMVAKARGGLAAAKSSVQGVGRMGNPGTNAEHLWACAFLIFGFKSEPPLIQLKASDMVVFIKRTALPLALKSFTTFCRCNSAFELLKVCTNVLEEIEKSFVSQMQDWGRESLCWKQKLHSPGRVDEYFWQDVTLLKATLLETRAKLLLRGGHFDSGEELCRTCVSIRSVMLGHAHAHTLAAQQTLAKLVRLRTNI